MAQIRYAMLGPIQVWIGAKPVLITAGRDRTLLVTLLWHAGTPVSVQVLIEAIWSVHPPRNAHNQVQGCVSRVRRHLAAADGTGAGLIVTDAAGYRLAADRADVDRDNFRRLRDEARSAVVAGDQEGAASRYRAALALWRGPALADIESPLIRRYAVALDEERVQALTDCLEVELALGKAASLVPELTELVREYPYQESIHAARMLALHRAGRTGDALAAYRFVQRLLHDELGTEPGQELVRLHKAILVQDPGLISGQRKAYLPHATTHTPRELPADVAFFTGRRDELDAMDRLLAAGSERGHGPVAISMITGTAGVGKTALALHWAHGAADRFPDGQLYVNLRGHASRAPLRPIEALASLLRSLGTPPDRIPTDEAQAAGLYRSQLATRQVLVLLDDANAADQVHPLLPGTPGCMVLVTSRHRLPGLIARDGAQRVVLDVLAPRESEVLLTRMLGRARVHAEADAARALASACAHLPLALRIAAASLADQPALPIAGYVTELATGDRLSRLQADDDGTAVRAALDYSYDRLPAEAQRMFWLLGLVPGPTIATGGGAALAGIRLDETKSLLKRLVSVHLLEEVAPGQYSFHDLLRDYAQERAGRDGSEPEQVAATRRLLGWYASGAASAAKILYPDVPQPVAPPERGRQPNLEFDGQAAAMAWLEHERANLVAAIRRAATTTDLQPLAWQLTTSLYGYFWTQRHVEDWREAVAAAWSATEAERTMGVQAALRWSASGIHRAAGQHADAIEELAAAVELARRSEWGEGESFALANLGLVQVVVGQLEDAGRCLTRALSLARQAGQRAIEARILGNLGYLSKQAGRLREAADYCAAQLSVVRQLHPPDGPDVARSLNNLGSVESILGRLAAADEKVVLVLAIHQKAGHRLGQLNALILLATLRVERGQLRDAKELAKAAHALARELGDPRKTAEAYNTLGIVHLNSSRPSQAAHCHRLALDTARLTNDPNSEFLALHGLALARYHLAQYEPAAEHAKDAWAIASRIGYRIYEGLAMTALAEVRYGQGQLTEAGHIAQRALDSHRRTGYRIGEAHAHVIVGNVLSATRASQAARRHWQAARRLFADVGAPVPDELVGDDPTVAPTVHPKPCVPG